MAVRLKALHEATLRLASELDTAQREQFEALIRLRDEVLDELKAGGALSEEERTMLRKIDECNGAIVSRMTDIRDEAERSLGRLRHAKLQRSFYEQAYSGQSFFFDKKK